MVAVQKIDSNSTGLRYQEEVGGCIGVAEPNNDWVPLEPNSYSDFGAEFTLVARNPINAGRQRLKGVITDLDASGGFQSDLTQKNLADLLQGFLFADFRRKADVGPDSNPRRAGIQDEFADYTITDIDGAAEQITVDSRVAVSAAVVAAGAGYAVGDVVQVTNASATIQARFIVTGETGGAVDTVALVLSGFTGGVEGRTDTDTGAGAATTVITGGGNGALTLTVTYGNGISWQAGDLVFLADNNDAQNDGVKRVTVAADNVITVAEDLLTDASPAAAATMTTIGFQGAAGDIDVDASGALPALTSTALDFTTLGLIPGELVFIGGDLAIEAFTTAANNGWKRVATSVAVAAQALTIDKSQLAMVTEASTTETIHLYFGRVLKNESDPALQIRRTYQLERPLGTPDPALPAEIQAEYLEGSVPGDFTFNFGSNDKVTIDLAFTATNHSTVDGPTALKSGNRPTLSSEDAFNTTSDFSRLRLAVLDPSNEAPTALFAFLTEFTIAITNNLSPNKAISVLGAFEVTAGQFNVDGTMGVYFADVAGIDAIRNNSDVTLDFALVKGATGAKRGVAVDVPLIALGDGRLDVSQDEPITLPLSTPAAADNDANHTLMMSFFDHLPDAADI